MSGRVVILGSLNVDLVTAVERHPRPGETVIGHGLSRLAGGKGANQAVAAAAAGAEAFMVGCVGDDAGGVAYRARLTARGIDVSGVRVCPGKPTGHALVVVDEAGENSIVVVPGANAAVGLEDLAPFVDLGPGDVLLAQLEIPIRTLCAAVRTAAGRGARVVLNLAPYATVPADVIALADPVVVNEIEAAALAESGAVPGSVLVTMGGHGVTWDGVSLPAHDVAAEDVVDTTGAGDAFCGALAAALASGSPREAAMDAALAAGARTVTHRGAQPQPEL